MSRGYDSCDMEFTTALAASAFAIHSIRSQETGSGYRRKTSTREDDEPFRPAKTVSQRKPSQRDTTRTSSAFSRAKPVMLEDQRSKEKTSRVRRINADSWEEAQMIKIRKRYEKMYTEIKAWEKEKKMEEKGRFQRRESELVIKKSRGMKHYQSKISRINHLADAAMAQIEEKRRVQVCIAKEKASKMRSTGKVSVKYCLCF